MGGGDHIYIYIYIFGIQVTFPYLEWRKPGLFGSWPLYSIEEILS